MSTALEFLCCEEVQGDERQGDMHGHLDYKTGMIRVDSHSHKVTSRQSPQHLALLPLSGCKSLNARMETAEG